MSLITQITGLDVVNPHTHTVMLQELARRKLHPTWKFTVEYPDHLCYATDDLRVTMDFVIQAEGHAALEAQLTLNGTFMGSWVILDPTNDFDTLALEVYGTWDRMRWDLKLDPPKKKLYAITQTRVCHAEAESKEHALQIFRAGLAKVMNTEEATVVEVVLKDEEIPF